MRTSDFDFILPEALIAQFPTKERSGSRLLKMDISGHLIDAQFIDLPKFLSSGDLLVFNNTKVIKARLYGKKMSGGNVELLIERVIDHEHALAHIKASRSPQAGSKLILANAIQAEVLGRSDALFHLKFESTQSILELLDEYGALPLPPYITHTANDFDENRYQTVFAQHAGAVAAPTAGLHFDEAMLNTLNNHGILSANITLHVGAGTFQPVRSENIHEHKMHSEIYSIPQETVDLIQETKARGNRVIAIGTTAMRALESASQSGKIIAGDGETDIFITPGYQFKTVDRLFTNFHLPKSTLLMLVSAFSGIKNIRAAYQHAIEEKYRFFSYGDAMLIDRVAQAELN